MRDDFENRIDELEDRVSRLERNAGGDGGCIGCLIAIILIIVFWSKIATFFSAVFWFILGLFAMFFEWLKGGL